MVFGASVSSSENAVAGSEGEAYKDVLRDCPAGDCSEHGDSMQEERLGVRAYRGATGALGNGCMRLRPEEWGRWTHSRCLSWIKGSAGYQRTGHDWVFPDHHSAGKWFNRPEQRSSKNCPRTDCKEENTSEGLV